MYGYLSKSLLSILLGIHLGGGLLGDRNRLNDYQAVFHSGCTVRFPPTMHEDSINACDIPFFGEQPCW